MESGEPPPPLAVFAKCARIACRAAGDAMSSSSFFKSTISRSCRGSGVNSDGGDGGINGVGHRIGSTGGARDVGGLEATARSDESGHRTFAETSSCAAFNLVLRLVLPTVSCRVFFDRCTIFKSRGSCSISVGAPSMTLVARQGKHEGCVIRCRCVFGR